MGIPLLAIAVVFFIAAYQNQLSCLATEAETDIKGFLPWAAAMAIIGAIGLIGEGGRKVSNALFALVFLVLFVANKGIFANIQSGQAFKTVPPCAKPIPAPGQTAMAPAAPPGTMASGMLDTGTAGGGGIMSNILPFPNLKFGPFNLGTGASSGTGSGSPTAGGGSFAGSSAGGIIGSFPGGGTGGQPDNSGVTIENIDIGP